jgi:ureidoacrylate peracid hydrolase
MGVMYDLTTESPAVLVIDMTNDFLTEGAPMEIPIGREIIDNINALTARSREVGVPVIFARHMHRSDGCDIGRMADNWHAMVDEHGKPTTLLAGSAGVRVYNALAPHDSDITIDKHRSSAFFETELDTILRELHVTTVLITGMATNGCCHATALDASYRGYRVVFLSDATATNAMPDFGFGEFSLDTVQRYTLSLVALAIGEVASTDDVVDRLAQRVEPAVHGQGRAAGAMR